MAYANWITVTPTSGSNNGTSKVTTGEYKGRSNRTSTITVTGAKSKTTSSISVTQKGAAEYVSVSGASSIHAFANGNGDGVSFVTNAKTLTFSIVAYSGDLGDAAAIPTTGTTFSNSTSNGEQAGTWSGSTFTATGDPGANGEYKVTIKATIPTNTTSSVRKGNLKVTTNSGVSNSDVTITQLSGANITVDKTSLTFEAAGGDQTIKITSNESWTIS